MARHWLGGRRLVGEPLASHRSFALESLVVPLFSRTAYSLPDI